jgi:uncharacterized phage protein (TIGR01671 family)
MREIKFRGWDGIQMVSNPINVTYDSGVNDIFYFAETGQYKMIFMQYTGLMDKHGKDIYEGDIVKTESNKPMVISWSDIHASFVIDRVGWAFRHYFGEAFDSTDCEVIGNIYENPDLLNNG